jgi:hypothetical protein
MTLPTTGHRASDSLLSNKEELARAITDRLFAAQPDVLDRYGEPGRAKCLQDMRYNLEHLAAAVALGEPDLFVRYVRWLDDLLCARNIPASDVRRSLEVMQAVILARLPSEEAAAIAACIQAGLVTFPATGRV